MEQDLLMSTRCLIGLEEPDGSCRMIYCHHDGYPSHVGQILFDSYTRGKLEGLLALGDISGLHDTLKDTVAYARDRGEDLAPNRTFRDVNDLLRNAWRTADAEWVYIWKTQVDLFSPKVGWYCASTWHPISELKPLEEVLHESN